MAGEIYILRIPRDDAERQLYARDSLYVGIRREWSYGTKVLFVRKVGNDDAFIGSGIIDKIIMLGELTEEEKKLCLENNWYCKLLFGMVARFHPSVPVKDTPAAGENSLVLHGAIVSTTNFSKIEKLARAKIMS
jgi:hypothetical protein